MSLYEQLASKYPCQVIEPFKEPVLIIGVKQFQPQWEEQLKAEGCKILVSDYVGKSCFLIRKPQTNNGNSQNKAENSESAVQIKPKQHRKSWSWEETQRLIQLYKEGKTYQELSEIFQRTKKCIQQKLYDLGVHKQVEVKPFKLGKHEANPPNNNEVEVSELLEASIMLLPKHKKAAKVLIQQALTLLG